MGQSLPKDQRTGPVSSLAWPRQTPLGEQLLQGPGAMRSRGGYVSTLSALSLCGLWHRETQVST